jgi:eukaryotic-like serine/threonine-protein kinase
MQRSVLMVPMSAKTIFIAAIELPASERAAYVNDAVGDDADLRARVDALLRAHDDPESYLDRSVMQFAGVDRAFESPLPAERIGTLIGPYKLLEQIGEGGMGVVYMAEQQFPVRRRVALKIIKIGMDTRQVIARFEAERQALALMEHANIARVLDAGATDSGRPYFVMELVRGIPITEYCDQNNVPIRERLKLFIEVCNAVQHAHQKGIIHRDIKPSNVLVTVNDGRAVPKVIDFGVAKATSQQLTEKTLFTAFTQMIGTPLYMSPEQADMSSVDIDTRSDIYSLGVLLYELLTGTTPFDQQRLRQSAFDEIRRIIREEEPPKPSTRISTLGAARTATAAHRNVEIRRLGQLVDGDLDWIVMKSLEKARQRRYETASDLIKDIERHLADQPVEARSPSARYRFYKFARRNRRAVLTALAVTIALLLAVVTLAISNARITVEKNQKSLALRDREAALTEKGAALESARASEGEAKSQEGLARRRFYASQMNLAMQAWEAGQPARMLQLLESQRPRFDQEDLRGFDWYYLWRLCQGTYRFSLPTRNVDNAAAVAISPDGKTLASGYGHTVRLWDVSTGRLIGELLGHDSTIGSLAFAPDGKILASTDVETMKLWDLATRKEAAILKPGQVVRGMQFTGDSRILALAGKSVQLWDVVTNREICNLGESDKEPFRGVAVAPDGNAVAASGNGQVRIWIREESAWREAPRLQTGYYPPLAISPDGKLLAVGYTSLTLYDLPSRQERIPLLGHIGHVFAIAFADDGKRLVSGGADRTVRMWDVATGKQQVCIANPGPVYGLALAPDASVVAAMGTDAIRVWDVAPLAPAMVLRHAAPVYAVAFSPDGKTLASGGRDGTKLWDPSTGMEISTLGSVPTPYMSTSGLAFSPDGTSLASSGVVKGTIDIWDLTGRRLAALTTGGQMFHRLAFSPDGKSLAEANGGSGDLAPVPAGVWDLASQRRRLALSLSKTACAVAYSPDGKTLAVGGQYGIVKLFDAQSGRELTTLQRFVLAIDWIDALAFSPDGHKLATGNRQGVVHIWDVATNQLVASLIGHTNSVTSLAFGDGGRTLATASDDRTIRLWDVATGQERITLKGHQARVTCVAFAPDGNALATSSEDETVRLWPAAADAGARARRREVDPDDAQSPAAHNERGDRLWQYGRVDEAEAAYRQALDRLEKLRVAFPDDSAYAQEMVRSLLSVSLLLRVERDPHRGDIHSQAEPARLRALAIYRALSPEDRAVTFWAFSERHRHMYGTGNTKQQVDRIFSQIIELIPEDDVDWLIRGARHLAYCDDIKLRDPPRAVELARQAVTATMKDRKDRAEALVCLVDVLKNDKRSAEAKEILQQALVQYSEDLAVTPELFSAWSGRADCYLRKAAYVEAVADFTQAIKLKPDDRWSWHERGYCYLMLGQYEKSIVDHSKAIELEDQEAVQRVRRGDSYRALGQLQKAEEDYSRAIELDPSDAGTWYARARVYAQQHNAEKASRDLASMMKLPMDPNTQNGIAWSLVTDPDSSWRNAGLAVELSEKAIAARPTDGMIWNTVGTARYRNGQWKDAIAAFDKSIQFRNGGDSADWFFLAMCNWQLGDREAAGKWYGQAVAWMDKNSPDNREFRRFRAEAEELLKIPNHTPATRPLL